MATPTPHEMVQRVKAATEDHLLFALTTGTPHEDAALGFTQALANAELQRRIIARYAWAIWGVLGLQATQVFVGLMAWHPWR